MAIGDPIVPPIPAVGTSGTSYASQLVDFLEEVKERLENAVPLTSILVSLLDMANNAIANLSYLSLYEQEVEPDSPVGSLQNFEGNLWWVSDSGAAQLTSGNALNAASIGGIDGDYGGGNPASFRFTDADETFYAYDDFGGDDWAWLGARGIYIYGAEDSTTRVKLTAAVATGNYTVTFATALPAAKRLVQIDENGQLSYSNTILAATGITLSGAQSLGKIFHDTYNIAVPITLGACHVAAGTVDEVAGIPGISMLTSATVYIPLVGIPATKMIKGFTVTSSDVAASAAVFTLTRDLGSGLFSDTAVTVTTTSTSASATGDASMASGFPYYLKIVSGAVGGLGGVASTPRYVTVAYASE